MVVAAIIDLLMVQLTPFSMPLEAQFCASNSWCINMYWFVCTHCLLVYSLLSQSVTHHGHAN